MNENNNDLFPSTILPARSCDGGRGHERRRGPRRPSGDLLDQERLLADDSRPLKNLPGQVTPLLAVAQGGNVAELLFIVQILNRAVRKEIFAAELLFIVQILNRAVRKEIFVAELLFIVQILNRAVRKEIFAIEANRIANQAGPRRPPGRRPNEVWKNK